MTEGGRFYALSHRFADTRHPTPDTRHLTPDTIGMRLTVNYG